MSLRSIRAIRSTPWALVVLASTLPAHAQAEVAPVESATLHRLTVVVENDKFAGTDKFYTNGFKLAYQRNDVGLVSTFVSDTISLIPFLAARPLAWGLVLGQDLYTPEKTELTALIPDDRPYGAWLYAGVSLTRGNRPRDGEPQPSFLFQDRIELLFGAIGEAAQGEEVQNNWHKFINVSLSEGWRNQLKSEPAAQLYLQRKWLLKVWPAAGWGPGADFLPHFGGAFGTVFTHLSIGGTFRFGWNLGDRFGPTQRIASAGMDELQEPDGQVRLYVFGRIEGRLVLHNALIDGGLFRSQPRRLSVNGVVERHHIDRVPFVADFEVGVVFEWQWLAIGFTSVTRTREFEQQVENFTFGAVHVQLTF